MCGDCETIARASANRRHSRPEVDEMVCETQHLRAAAAVFLSGHRLTNSVAAHRRVSGLAVSGLRPLGQACPVRRPR
jgi:hypothetical protein